jgi:hypothetical protein
MRDVGANALPGSMALICCARPPAAESAERRDPACSTPHLDYGHFLREFDKVLPSALEEMSEKRDAVGPLVYCLYSFCERQKWAEVRLAYNELVPLRRAIVGARHRIGHKGPQLDVLGDA